MTKNQYHVEVCVRHCMQWLCKESCTNVDFGNHESPDATHIHVLGAAVIDGSWGALGGLNVLKAHFWETRQVLSGDKYNILYSQTNMKSEKGWYVVQLMFFEKGTDMAGS